MILPSRPVRHVLIVLFCLIAALSCQAFAGEPPVADFDAYVEGVMKDAKVPGLAIAIIQDDKVVFSRGYGVRKLGSPDKVDEDTVFPIGSTTKAFTSALIAMLVDEGKMKWDGHVTDYLPDFRLYDSWVTREVTLRDLLCHRTGLPETGFLWYASPLSSEEVLQRLRFQQPESSFRSQYAYQNVMYLAAGRCAAAVAHKSWQELIKERIFKPLCMTSSSTSVTELAGLTNVASPHSMIVGSLKEVPYRNIDSVAPAGTINSNIKDMAQWIRLLLAEGRFGDKQLIETSSVAEMLTPQIHVPAPEGIAKKHLGQFRFFEYALGWLVQGIGGHRAIWHTGGIDGMRSFVGLLPDEHIGIVVLSNSDAYDQPHTIGIGLRLLDAYLKQPSVDWAAVWLAEVKDLEARVKKVEDEYTSKRVPGTHPSLKLDKYTGKYTSELNGEVAVSLNDGKLVMQAGPARVADLVHWHYNTFQAIFRDPVLDKVMVNFHLDGNAEISNLKIAMVGTFTHAARPK